MTMKLLFEFLVPLILAIISLLLIIIGIVYRETNKKLSVLFILMGSMSFLGILHAVYLGYM